MEQGGRGDGAVPMAQPSARRQRDGVGGERPRQRLNGQVAFLRRAAHNPNHTAHHFQQSGSRSWFRPGVGPSPLAVTCTVSGRKLGNRSMASASRGALSRRVSVDCFLSGPTSLAVGADPRRLSHQPLRVVACTADRARRCAAARRDLALRLQASARSPCACVSLVGTHPPPRLLGRPLRAVRPLGCGGPWLRVCACALGRLRRRCWRWRRRCRWRRLLAGANQLVR